MRDRLGLVIHWAGFVLGTFFFVLFSVSILIIELDHLNFRDALEIRTSTIFLAFLGLLASNIVGWIVRFILTGNKSFFPWK
jgi:hypothetical protein